MSDSTQKTNPDIYAHVPNATAETKIFPLMTSATIGEFAAIMGGSLSAGTANVKLQKNGVDIALATIDFTSADLTGTIKRVPLVQGGTDFFPGDYLGLVSDGGGTASIAGTIGVGLTLYETYHNHMRNAQKA